ncbi:MAG: hypothetical protein ACLQAH_15690 [Limisphaerales bacterium]
MSFIQEQLPFRDAVGVAGERSLVFCVDKNTDERSGPFAEKSAFDEFIMLASPPATIDKRQAAPGNSPASQWQFPAGFLGGSFVK